MRRGRVTAPVPERNSETSNSSNEVMKANTAPANMPGAISGRVTWRKTPNGGAPRLAAACCNRLSTPARAAETLITTNGTASVV